MTTTTAALTHHAIIDLAAPFTRQGLAVDLAASDRVARRLVFRPKGDGGATLREHFELRCGADAAAFALIRTLAHAAGLEARLTAEGEDAAALLAAAAAVPRSRLFQAGTGWTVARSYALQAGRPSPPTAAAAWVLSAGTVRTESLVLTFEVMALRGASAALRLAPAAGAMPALPEDLLAVLGWDWSRLVRHEDGWTARLRLRGGLARRTRRVEAALTLAAGHLARTLAAPPVCFHDCHRLARWGVVARRLIPTLTALGLIAGALALPRLTDGEHAGLYMALHYVPIALLALSFKLQELPRFEIPPWPRRSRAASWQPAAQANERPGLASGGGEAGRPAPTVPR